MEIIREGISKGKINEGSCIWWSARGESRSRGSRSMVTVVYIAILSRIEAKKFGKTSKAEGYVGAIGVLSSEGIPST
jgi:hypothetical protein